MPGFQVKADFWINEYITPWDIYAHGITRVLTYKKTKYQEMYIVETGAYGKALILDGKWQSSTLDEFLYHEPLVHPAMIFHQAPRSVLVLGGGEGATIREILRWKDVQKVVMVDIDGEVVEACRRHLSEMHQGAFDDPRVELVIDDALNYIEQNKISWDIVISDLADPIEEGPSFKLFTQEYFQKINNILASSGLFVVQAGPVAPAEIKLHARLVKTLKTVFPFVHSYCSFISTYGSPWGFAICSRNALNTRPDPEEIDRILKAKTKGGFKFIDGSTLLGLMQTPLHLRRAIEKETLVYTLKQPPKFNLDTGEK
ncbi:MAG: methyltransferase domain-containing protein [Calditrichaeota bacterium]|nr:MAG: methyltransferase domain-containing protein [Calditrichota bacterium]